MRTLCKGIVLVLLAWMGQAIAQPSVARPLAVLQEAASGPYTKSAPHRLDKADVDAWLRPGDGQGAQAYTRTVKDVQSVLNLGKAVELTVSIVPF